MLLSLVVAVVISTAGCNGTTVESEQRQKNALLASLHRGMSRVDFYRAARRLGVKPGNPEYVRFGPSGGPPIDNGDFPMPNASHPHPMVFVFLHKPQIGCDIPTDEVDVYFDRRDQVEKWVLLSIVTGKCL
jgi:phosphopantetheinyl transferase